MELGPILEVWKPHFHYKKSYLGKRLTAPWRLARSGNEGQLRVTLPRRRAAGDPFRPLIQAQRLQLGSLSSSRTMLWGRRDPTVKHKD
jgi:hypothetical protein